MPSKYLKKGNVPILVIYLVWSIALFLVFFNGASDFWPNVKLRLSELQARDSLFCFLTPLILAIASGILPASWKATLVFWRFRYALPGCRAFSQLAKSDLRIDQSRIMTILGRNPASPDDENAVWYRCYKAVQDRLIVREAHKQFLLNRDLACISFLFFVFGTPCLLFSDAPPLGIITYAGVAMLQYALFAIVARNHGNRFVCNVLVEYQNEN